MKVAVMTMLYLVNVFSGIWIKKMMTVQVSFLWHVVGESSESIVIYCADVLFCSAMAVLF